MKLTKEDIQKFLMDVPRTGSHQELCGYLLNPFLDWLRNEEFDESAVRRYVEQRYAKASSANTFLAVIKSFCEWKKKRIPIGVSQEELRKTLLDTRALDLIMDIKPLREVKELKDKYVFSFGPAGPTLESDFLLAFPIG